MRADTYVIQQKMDQIKQLFMRAAIWLIGIYTAICLWANARYDHVTRKAFAYAYRPRNVAGVRVFKAYITPHVSTDAASVDAEPAVVDISPRGISADTTRGRYVLDVTADVNFLIWRHAGAPSIGHVCVHFDSVYKLQPNYIVLFMIDMSDAVHKTVIDLNSARELLTSSDIDDVNIGAIPKRKIIQL